MPYVHLVSPMPSMYDLPDIDTHTQISYRRMSSLMTHRCVIQVWYDSITRRVAKGNIFVEDLFPKDFCNGILEHQYQSDISWSSRPPTAVAVRSKFKCQELGICDLNRSILDDSKEMSDTSEEEVDRGPAPPAAPRLLTRRRRRRPTAMDGRRHRIFLMPKRRRPRR